MNRRNFIGAALVPTFIAPVAKALPTVTPQANAPKPTESKIIIGTLFFYRNHSIYCANNFEYFLSIYEFHFGINTIAFKSYGWENADRQKILNEFDTNAEYSGRFQSESNKTLLDDFGFVNLKCSSICEMNNETIIIFQKG